MHHHTADDPATATQLPPLHRVVPTTGTFWPWRELIPKAIGAILDYQPLLIASVVEGLVHRIRYGGLFGHIFRRFRFQSKRARARLLSLGASPGAHPLPPTDLCRQQWQSALTTVRLRSVVPSRRTVNGRSMLLRVCRLERHWQLMPARSARIPATFGRAMARGKKRYSPVAIRLLDIVTM